MLHLARGVHALPVRTYAAIVPCRHIGATKFAQSELDFVKQKAGHHHDDTLPLLVYCSAYSRRRTCRGKAPPSANADRSVAQTPHWGVCCCRKRKPPINKKRTRTLSRKESGSYDLGRHSYGSRNRGLSNSPTGLIAYFADWHRQSRPVRVLYRPALT